MSYQIFIEGVQICDELNSTQQFIENIQFIEDLVIQENDLLIPILSTFYNIMRQ